jgi:hypothetical protein
MKKRKLKDRIVEVDESLANADIYLANNINVEGQKFLHFDDWNGKSGHPSWMKNHLVPTLKHTRSRLERTLDRIKNARKDKKLSRRKKRARGQ